MECNLINDLLGARFVDILNFLMKVSCAGVIIFLFWGGVALFFKLLLTSSGDD